MSEVEIEVVAQALYGATLWDGETQEIKEHFRSLARAVIQAVDQHRLLDTNVILN